MAGGSQIIINKNGITFITPAKFEAKAGQHLFKGGEKAPFNLQLLPLFIPEKDLCPLTTIFGGLPNSTLKNDVVLGYRDNNGNQKSDLIEAPETYPPEPNSSQNPDMGQPAKYPPIKMIDLSKIKGHSCTIIPAFKLNRYLIPNLSGTYYKTLYPSGKPDAIDYSPSHENSKNQYPNYHFEEIGGVKKSIPILYYGTSKGRKVNFDFNSEKNTLTISLKIYFYPSKLIEVATGKDLIYDLSIHQQKITSGEYKFVKRENTPELKNFIRSKEEWVNSLLNSEGYYFSPKNCNVSGGCTCKVAVILKIEYGTTDKEPLLDQEHDEYIFLLDKTVRQNSKYWAEFQSKKNTIQKPLTSKMVNGVIVNEGGGTETKYLLTDTSATIAHESSHLFGYPDEYYSNGGAVHKMYIGQNKYIDTTMAQPKEDWKREVDGNLMSSPKLDQLPVIPSYYYNEFLKVFEQKTHLEWEIKKI